MPACTDERYDPPNLKLGEFLHVLFRFFRQREIKGVRLREREGGVDGWIYMCVYTCTHLHIHIDTHTHAYVMHACMHACMHTYTHRRRPRQEQPRSSCLRERAYDGRFGTRRARGGKSGPDHRSSGSVRVRGCWRCPFDLIGCLLALVSFAGIARA